MIDYRKASKLFVDAAFCLLNMYKYTPAICDPNTEAYLAGDYGLRISADGKLNVVDPQGNLIAHSFNGAYSQITYIGKLLAVYLEHLQMDDC